MKTKKIYTGVSIDTNGIYVVFASVDKVDGSQTIIARKAGEVKLGIERGCITDPKPIEQCIKKIFNNIERLHSTHIEEVLVSFNPHTLTSKKKRIKRAVKKSDSPFVIYNEDATSMHLKMAQNYISSRPNHTLLISNPLSYSVDNIRNLDTPVDLVAKKEFSGEGFFVSCFKQNKQMLEKIFHNLGLEVIDIYPSSFVTASVLFPDEDKRAGALFVDIGTETSSWTYFYKGIPYSTGCIGVGTYDIACEAARTIGIDLSHIMNSIHTHTLNDDITHAKKNVLTRVMRKILSEIKTVCPSYSLVGNIIVLVPEGIKYECEKVFDSQLRSNIQYFEKKKDITIEKNNGSWIPVESLITYYCSSDDTEDVKGEYFKPYMRAFFRNMRSIFL